MKRKATGIFLLFVLIAPVAVTFSWLQMEKAHVRKAVKWQILNHVKKSELTLLQFSIAQSQNDLNWKHQGEFEWQEKMYDIVSFETKGDSIFYWCFADEEEEKINRKISAFLKDTWQNNLSKKEQEKRLDSFFKSLFVDEAESLSGMFPTIVAHQQFSFNSKLQQFGNRPPTPPPQG